MSIARYLAAVLIAALLSPLTLAAQAQYKIGPDDSLDISVVDQPDLTKKYVVDASGRIAFPFLGTVVAKDMTADELAADLRKRLSEGLLRNPQVSVAIERTRRVFVFGGVSTPGTYQMTDHMTLVEVLARAGYNGASEAIVVRTEGAAGPVLPGEDSKSQVIRVNLREFEKDIENGRLDRNVALMDGDTIYVPRFDPNRVYVSGEVKTPGAYSVPEGTTVLQLLTLAGGPTEGASLGRIRITRFADGKNKTVSKVKLEDVIQPGDTVVVPERFF